MSHYSKVKTSLSNPIILQKALSNLEITWIHEKSNVSKNSKPTIIIPQKNNHDIQFVWNFKKYDLQADLMFWELPLTFGAWTNAVVEAYAAQALLQGCKKKGFQVSEKFTNKKKNVMELKLERWSIKNDNNLI